MPGPDAAIDGLKVRVFCVPTDAPESDGTITWNSTTLIVVEITGGGQSGLGYSYAAAAAGAYIREALEQVILGRDVFDIPGAHAAMLVAVRNAGRPGIASSAISALDVALWDLKAKLLGLPLARLLGRAEQRMALYGSGGFTSYDDARLAEQLGGWAAEGMRFVKMKIGREPERDAERVRVARQAIGPDCQLFVDANGAHHRSAALRAAATFAEYDVRWFEEPVSSDDLAGLRALREHSPAGMAIAAGEYGYDIWYFRCMLQAQAVDVLQADASRCGGITGFLQAADLARAFNVPFSAHTAPSLHLAPCCAVGAVHMEWFYDHVRIEQMFFDGAATAIDGYAAPNLDRPGLGLSLREADAEPYAL